MPRVDFYVVASPERETLSRVACRLIEKAWLAGNSVFVHTGSEQQAAQLDEALWTFKQDSFVPHTLYPPPGDEWTDVLLGYGAEPSRALDVLVNLSSEVPAFYQRFGRIAELIGADAQARESGRERYRYYREQGCMLHSHHL